MNSKKSRIAAFIETLPSAATSKEVQSTLLRTKMDYMGMGVNDGNCTNDMYKQCNKSKNGGSCKNYSSACPDATNHGNCLNTSLDNPIPIRPPKEAIGVPNF